MNCVERYRRQVIRGLNRDLGIILQSPDEVGLHNFRVGIKRISALYRFLHLIEPELDAPSLLAPYRALFKAAGSIRDTQIVQGLVASLDSIDPGLRDALETAMQASIGRDFKRLRRVSETHETTGVRLPTIRASGISERAILRARPIALASLREKILRQRRPMTARRWHRKRILLKRYRHTLDAFQYCPGQASDLAEIEQVRLLEQLLGDWHDRVIAIDWLRTLEQAPAESASLVRRLQRQERALLGSADIYLDRLRAWHRTRRSAA